LVGIRSSPVSGEPTGDLAGGRSADPGRLLKTSRGTNSGPVRTTEYDLFIDRVDGSLGWGECLAGNERICESVDARDFSWRQRWTTSCACSPAVSDDDQCFRRPVFSSPCDRRNLRLSIAACAALRLLLPNFQTRDCLESVRHDKSGHLSVRGETEACDGRDSPAAAGEVPFAQLSLVRG
jgi:hypothetical protein